MKLIGYLVVTAALLIFSHILSGWTISILWEWFAVPIFDLPSLGVPQAIGVSLVFGYMAHKVDISEK